jgi:hypothetical protein
MLRWLIAVLFLANLLAFVMVRGVFGPTPAAGEREPSHLKNQVRPQALQVQSISATQTDPPAVVGGPVREPGVAASALTQ